MASAKWLTLSADARLGKQIRGGWYEYELRREEAGLRIGRKKIVLLEDVIDGAVDIHQRSEERRVGKECRSRGSA